MIYINKKEIDKLKKVLWKKFYKNRSRNVY